MAKEKPEKPAEEQVVLTDTERLAILEGQNKLNRLLLFILLGLLGVALPIVLTIALVGGGESDEAAAAGKQVEAVQAQVKTLDARLVALEQLQAKQAEQLAAVQATAVSKAVQAVAGSSAAAPAGADPATVAQVSKALLEQERDLQLLLQNQQTSMRDLANMLPGSRSWLEDYHESLGKLMASSRARVLELQRWAKDAGKP